MKNGHGGHRKYSKTRQISYPTRRQELPGEKNILRRHPGMCSSFGWGECVRTIVAPSHPRRTAKRNRYKLNSFVSSSIATAGRHAGARKRAACLTKNVMLSAKKIFGDTNTFHFYFELGRKQTALGSPQPRRRTEKINRADARSFLDPRQSLATAGHRLRRRVANAAPSATHANDV